MPNHVADRLTATIASSGSLACVGLDPRPNLVPPGLFKATTDDDPRAVIAQAFLAFNRAILEAIAGHCAAVKPQVACYEAYGWRGMQALEQTIAIANDLDIPVIVDGKRNDIGSTATHYQQAWLGSAPAADGSPLPGAGGDWLTINAYLGSDGVVPFLADDRSTGVFVLVKTSNPGSGELQGRPCDDSTVMETMADLVADWGTERTGDCGLNDIGAVVGATWPEEARTLRQRMPDTLFLVPGYGAQGGTAADALAGLRDDGQGVLVNSSRGIIGAWQKAGTDNVGAAALAALQAMNEDLNSAR